jgi:hypothetical protein
MIGTGSSILLVDARNSGYCVSADRKIIGEQKYLS